MILITGASSGIGEACARKFAAEGRKLILLARRKERLERLSSELRTRHSVEVHAFELDVSDSEAVSLFFTRHGEIFSQLEVVINNAGVAKGLDLIQHGTPSEWDEMIDTNLKGLLYVTRATLPYLLARKSGHVILLGSVAGYWSYPKGNVYSATKFAVRGLTEALRLDLLGTGVRVTEIVPGMVETEFSEVRLGDAERAKAVYAGMTPLSAEDIAESISWCVSRPAHVNIQELVIYPTDQASPTAVHRSSQRKAQP